MSDAQANAMRDTLNQRTAGKTPPCMWCGKKDWVIHSEILEWPQFGGVKRPTGGEFYIYPVALMKCQNCHMVVPFGAAGLGMMEGIE